MMELMKLAKLGMNEYEKMANELIEKKEKLDCNLENFFLKISIILLHLSPLIVLSNNKLNAIFDDINFCVGVHLICVFYWCRNNRIIL